MKSPSHTKFFRNCALSYKLLYYSPGEEFGVACFEELETAKVHEVFMEQIENVEIEVPKEIMQEVKVPISKDQMLQLQKNDEYCRQIVRRTRAE